MASRERRDAASVRVLHANICFCTDPANRPPSPVTPLVGRVGETEALPRLLAETTAGRPAALVIDGEAGIGKTTLWLAAVDRARRHEMRVLTARAASAES